MSWIGRLLTGPWRFSKRWPARPVSRLMCRCGRHVWLSWDGRPVNCLVCGLMGHPVAHRELKAKIADALGRLEDQP